VSHVYLQGVNSVIQRQGRESGKGGGIVVVIVSSLFPFPCTNSYLRKGRRKGGQGWRSRPFAAAAAKVGVERREGEEKEQGAGQEEAKGGGGVVEEGGLKGRRRQGTEHAIAQQEEAQETYRAPGEEKGGRGGQERHGVLGVWRVMTLLLRVVYMPVCVVGGECA
jgi:hypothetical protein